MKAWHRKSKSASGFDGIRQIQENRAVSRLSMDARAYIDERTRDSLPFVLELGQSSSRKTSETPMKKLLAQEMSKEVNPKRRSPSIVAKLMGLEGLPSPRYVPRPQKELSQSCQRKQEFKDVHEDMEASHIMNRRCSSRRSGFSVATKPGMVQNHQKLMDSKHSYSDEKFHQSNDLDSIMDMLNSSEALSLKFTQNPDSYFGKHLKDLQVNSSSSLHNHLIELKTHAKYYGSTKILKSMKENSAMHDTSSYPKREDGLLLDPHNRHRVHIPHNSSNTLLEEKNILPTRIVVLKPNLRKIRNSGTPFPMCDQSYDQLPNFSDMKERSIGGAEALPCKIKDLCSVGGMTKSMSKEAREKAREITRRVKDGCDRTMTLMSSGVRGYTGDESSYDDFETDSESESEMFKLLSRNSYESTCRYPVDYFVKSHVDREAKNRLSERWKISRRYEDAQIVCKESTLGEMLARRDRESRPRYLNAKVGFGRATNDLDRSSYMRNGSSDISHRNGSKDKINRPSPRSKSLPPSIDKKGQRKITRHAYLHDNKNLVKSDPVRHCTSTVTKVNTSQKEDISTKSSKFRSNKPISCHDRSTNELDSSSVVHFQIQLEPHNEELLKQHPMFQSDSNDEACSTPVCDVTQNIALGNTNSMLKLSELPPKQASTSVDSDVMVFDQEDCVFQELPKRPLEAGCPSLQSLETELDSSESSKETEHLSPVSVLEIPFTEDVSSAESFERVGAELRELRMQLKLLKMESGIDVEAEAAVQSPTGSEGNCTLGGDDWETSYVHDVLIGSGYEDSGFDMFKMWHRPECPLDPGLFNNLEKKYGEDTTVPKHERQMVFDRINSALVQIFQHHVDVCPWVMPKLMGLDPDAHKEKVRNAFQQLIWQDNSNGDTLLESLFEHDVLWLHFETEMELIGNDIEKSLLDDMIVELFVTKI